MKRILVIGTSGSGKSTLANQLSELLHIQFFPSDNFYWEAGWKVVSSEKVYKQVSAVVSQKEWILDGNFDDERELVWKQADCIIWLDYSLAIIFRRIVFRNFLWTMTRKTVWSGNQMGVFQMS
jgi:adenylate kinase family enzyme